MATVVQPAAPPEIARYTAVHVRQENHWYRASVREVVLPASPMTPDALNELASMVGDWQGEGEQSRVQLRCGWTGGGRFLYRSFLMGAGEDG